jgi:hypothetical protein
MDTLFLFPNVFGGGDGPLRCPTALQDFALGLPAFVLNERPPVPNEQEFHVGFWWWASSIHHVAHPL